MGPAADDRERNVPRYLLLAASEWHQFVHRFKQVLAVVQHQQKTREDN